MRIFSIFITIVFSIILCMVEVPRMLKKEEYPELWTYSILLTIGVVLVILITLDISVPNPLRLVQWVYSPLKGLAQSISK